MTDNDNATAFDYILPTLSIVTCHQLGLPKSAALFIFTLLWTMSFKLGTGHGVLSNSHSTNIDSSHPGQGSGQGQGSCPMLYGTLADLTLSTYGQHCTGAIFQHPSKEDPPWEDHVAQFVDDATQLLNMDGTEAHFTISVIESLHTEAESTNESPLTLVTNGNSKKWSIYNCVSGGKLNFSKCFWCLLHPTWNSKSYGLATKTEISGKIGP